MHQVEPYSRRERSGSLLAKSRALFARDLTESVVTKRLAVAFAAYTALGVLAFTTLPDPRFRFGTLAILAMFAVKTWVRRKDFLHPDGESGSE